MKSDIPDDPDVMPDSVPEDFNVSALIRNMGSGSIQIIPLKFSASGRPGLFEGSYNITEPGFYDATILAVQKGTGNAGAGQVTFFTKGATSS